MRLLALAEERGVKAAFASLQVPADPRPGSSPVIDLEACKEFVRAEVAAGRDAVSSLKEAWAQRQGRPHTLRRALDQLHAKHFRQGGSTGHWRIALPDRE
jgi:hypothetical protein